MANRNRSFRAIYEARLFRPPKGATGRQARTFPTMARALRELPESWLPDDAGDVWIWSDLHLGHERIIFYAKRPYKDAAWMDDQLLKNWEDTAACTGPESILVCVGDVAMQRGMTEANFSRIGALPGRKILVPGNHDFSGAGELRAEGFNEVCAVLYADGDPRLIFTHVPIATEHLPEGWVSVHGHMHNAPPENTPHINVSVEQLDYRPVELSRIRVLAGALARKEYPAGRTTLERIAALEA